MIRHCKLTHGTKRKSYIKITRHQEDKQSKATSSLFPIKMITKLEMTRSNVQQNMEQTQNAIMGAQSTTNQQQQNRRLRTNGKQFSETVSSKDALDNNTRLKISSRVCLTCKAIQVLASSLCQFRSKTY